MLYLTKPKNNTCSSRHLYHLITDILFMQWKEATESYKKNKIIHSNDNINRSDKRLSGLLF